MCIPNKVWVHRQFPSCCFFPLQILGSVSSRRDLGSTQNSALSFSSPSSSSLRADLFLALSLSSPVLPPSGAPRVAILLILCKHRGLQEVAPGIPDTQVYVVPVFKQLSKLGGLFFGKADATRVVPRVSMILRVRDCSTESSPTLGFSVGQFYATRSQFRCFKTIEVIEISKILIDGSFTFGSTKFRPIRRGSKNLYNFNLIQFD